MRSFSATCVAVVAILGSAPGCRTEHEPSAAGPVSPTAGGSIPAPAASAHVGAAGPASSNSTCTAPPPGASARLVLERTACFGFCPAYSVEVHPDGTVSYEGNSFVRVHGKVTTTIARPVADALFAQAACSGWAAWAPDYTEPITDNPAATVTVDMGRGAPVAVVRDYPPCHKGGAGTDTPDALCQLEEAIDAAAGTDAWVPCPAPDGGKTYCTR